MSLYPMPNQKPDGAATSVEQHVQKILAQISALKRRLRAHEEPIPNGSRDSAVEVDREDDPSDGIDGVQRPA
jgi:hypothetical protein